MRLVFMGTPDFAVASLRALLEAGHEVVGVVTQPDRPRRRRSARPEPSPIKRQAASAALTILQPERVGDPGFVEQLQELAPQTVVVVAYGQILPAEVLSIAPRWAINLHASMLPYYRGAAPIARAIMAGEKVTGVTTMKMDRGLDTGDILLQKECAIGLTETAGELTARLAVLGAGLLVETLDRHARGELEPRRQDHKTATAAPPLSVEDGLIDWSDGAQAVASRVRGCNPWPLAYSFLRGEKVKILRAEEGFGGSGGGERGSPPGRVLALDNERVLVRCQGNSRVAISEMRFAGGRTMTARDALNGRLIHVGETFARTSIG